jgi:hypothetical protein
MFMGIVSVMLSLVISVVPIVLIVLAVRKFSGRSSHSQGASALRNFFQYALLLALMLVVTNGLSGLIGRFINPSAMVIADDASLARNLSFVIVGLPLLVGIGLWTRKGFQADSHRAKEPMAALFVTLATLIALVIALSSSIELLRNIASNDAFDGQTFANAVVWLGTWIALWVIGARTIPAHNLQVSFLLGSLVGYIASIVGLVGVISATIKQLTGMNGDALVTSSSHDIVNSLVVVLIGGLVWIQYWYRTARNSEHNNLWNAYVLIAGVGGGLVMAVVAASITLYQTAVWFIGEPHATLARDHFNGVPTSAGVVVIGLLAWWYHKSLLTDANTRTEVNRIYDYIISGIGLIASAVGLSMILIAILEATIQTSLIVGGSVINSFLSAATLIVVGGPVWVFYWRNIQSRVKQSPDVELTSITRRIYLFLLFGIGGVAAIISLIVGVFQLFNAFLTGEFGTSTLRDLRYVIGVLVSTAIISSYHWAIYRHERTVDVSFGSPSKSVVLIGPADKQIAHDVREATAARVTTWTRADAEGLTWSTPDVVNAILSSLDDQLVIVLDASGMKVIPLVRK